MEKAVGLWKKLSTRQVLALPEMAAVEDLRERFYQERRQMTKTALVEGGVSSAPLEKLVKENLDLSLLKYNSKIRLYTVSTKLPELAEVVTAIQQTKQKKYQIGYLPLLHFILLWLTERSEKINMQMVDIVTKFLLTSRLTKAQQRRLSWMCKDQGQRKESVCQIRLSIGNVKHCGRLAAFCF